MKGVFYEHGKTQEKALAFTALHGGFNAKSLSSFSGMADRAQVGAARRRFDGLGAKPRRGNGRGRRGYHACVLTMLGE